MEETNNQETIKICVEEFSRLQEWMEMTEKNSALYKSMKTRYRDLKVILSALGVNVTELDTIREQQNYRAECVDGLTPFNTLCPI